jgi:uncharacterized protein (TIGR02466 family)
MTIYPVKANKRINAQAAEYGAKEGLLLVFPSWLQHAVQPNRSDSDRVSISFNLGYRPVGMRQAQPAPPAS